MKGLLHHKCVKLITLAIGLFTASQTFAQQEAMYSQYMFNTLAINPAYAGSRDVLSMSAMLRYQWLGLDGAPSTQSFTIDMPIKNEKMGIGGAFYRDAIGVSSTVGGNAIFAYKVKLGARTTMSLGLQGGVENISSLLSNVANIGLDPVFSANNDINKMFPNAGAGIFISNDKGYLGVSVPKIIENKLSTYTLDGVDYSTSQKRHYFAMMGFVVGKGNVKIKPSTMLRYTAGTPLGIDGNINIWLKEKIAFGISGRKSQATLSGQEVLDAAVGMFELQLTPQLRMGYAYDFNQTSLNSFNNSNSSTTSKLTGTPTHEFLLRYEFGYGKNKILTPRYF
ncbi:type IX secretion system membrane protein, PorP/SprF family [Spirosomataceae bacterium TFI 002]|nr:type IX secretion system membrane protein, PorP/SprF family [Spirosomataceae bacterium TFI 002]